MEAQYGALKGRPFRHLKTELFPDPDTHKNGNLDPDLSELALDGKATSGYESPSKRCRSTTLLAISH
jgi:hypothetical protein